MNTYINAITQTIPSNTYYNFTLSGNLVNGFSCYSGNTGTGTIKISDDTNTNIGFSISDNMTSELSFNIDGTIRVTNYTQNQTECSITYLNEPTLFKQIQEYGLGIMILFMMIICFVLPYYMAVKFVLFIDKGKKIKGFYDKVLYRKNAIGKE